MRNIHKPEPPVNPLRKAMLKDVGNFTVDSDTDLLVVFDTLGNQSQLNYPGGGLHRSAASLQCLVSEVVQPQQRE